MAIDWTWVCGPVVVGVLSHHVRYLDGVFAGFVATAGQWSDAFDAMLYCSPEKAITAPVVPHWCIRKVGKGGLIQSVSRELHLLAVVNHGYPVARLFSNLKKCLFSRDRERCICS